MKQLTPSDRRALRARAHALHPIVMIGSAGLTEAVLKEIDLALKSHELIKIRMLGDDRDGRDDALERICAALDANPVQLIGKILVVFRPRPAEPETPPAVKRGPAAAKSRRGTRKRNERQSTRQGKSR
jgi:putative YhbY family RNA-binding protein